jgi:hypothetical protein
MPESTENRNLGLQPIHDLLDKHGLNNHDVVACDTTLALTHKVVQKARKGRMLTARMQKKVLAAVNAGLRQRNLAEVTFEDLFSYIGC